MTQHKRLRRLAILAAGAMASTVLVGVADAAVPTAPTAATGSFNWKVSTTFDTAFATHELAGGVTENEADGVLSFPALSSTVDPVSGAGTVQYDGSVKGSFVFGGVLQYWVKIEDPAVTVDADGEGRITAAVSGWNIAGMGSPEESTSPARVVVTTFDAADRWSTRSIAATPDWAGVLAAGSPEATALGITTPGQPVDGKSFAPSFLGQITSGVRARFYWTSGSDSKAPAPFTASYADAARSVATTPSYANQSVAIKVDGAGFTRTDNNPGDSGVYVGLAPAGGLPSTSSQADIDKFAAAQWVTAAAIKGGGKFSTTLTAAAGALKQGTAYSVYTWRAHSHSSTSQDTETPVTIDWSKLTAAPPATPTKAATKASAKVTKKPTTAKGGALSVTLKSSGGKPAGKVTVKLTSKGKKAVTRSAKAKKGKAVVKLPKLKAGTWKATVVYAGSDDFTSAKKVVTFKVKKSKKK